MNEDEPAPRVARDLMESVFGVVQVDGTVTAVQGSRPLTGSDPITGVLVNAVDSARAYVPVVGGKAFNLGGGISRSVSVKEMIAMIEQISHRELQWNYEPARPGDQMRYVSDNSRFSNQTSWMPRRTLEQTVRDISAFWHANRMFVMRPTETTRRKSIVRAA